MIQRYINRHNSLSSFYFKNLCVTTVYENRNLNSPLIVFETQFIQRLCFKLVLTLNHNTNINFNENIISFKLFTMV